MEKTQAWQTPVAIIIAGILIALAVMYRGEAPAAPTPTNDRPKLTLEAVRKVDPKTDHIRGDINAPIKIVEYSDLECPFCKRFHDTMNQVFAKYGQSGQIAWVYRHFPLDMHPKARPEAIATECAALLGGNEAFWQYLDKIFTITPSNNGLDLALLPQIAQEIGLDVTKFNTCLKNPAMAAKVEADYQNGLKAGATGTPFPVVISQNLTKADLSKSATLIEETSKDKTMIALKGALQLPAMEQILTAILKK